ncbi:MAG TPA: PilT/PilU family type 4a pilus ATPase [Thermoanaerobaculia bacterium]|nr:PilT/PilU family type 4a pilus ATPase [Thermoanaerobaculia bacterium]
MELSELLKFTAKKGASDLHLKPMRPPLLRLNGKMIPLKVDALGPKQLQDMLLPILTPMQKERLERNLAVDVGYGLQGVARFRANIYTQRGSYAAAFRRIPFKLPTVDELELPEVLGSFAHLPAGMVIVTGPTGSGKSTTLAAIMREIVEKRPVHIVTIEDPIEYLLSDGVAAVSQREVGTDTPSFQEALKNVVRQDPDVIMVGEMRDWETMQTAITAAETGHLVFSTLHTNNAAQSIDRMLDSCPPALQRQVRSQLALVLRAIVSMKLIEKVDGTGLTAVVEVMINSPKIAKHIDAGETKDILDEIESSVGYYRMQSMNQSLLALLVHQKINYDKAMETSTDPEDLSLKLRKLFPQIEESFRGGSMPSFNDFSVITGLLDTKKLYEEQEEKWKLRMSEVQEEVVRLRQELDDQRRLNDAKAKGYADLEGEAARLRNETERTQKDSAQKIAALNDRIKQLNQQLADYAGGRKPAANDGFFTR